MNDFGMSPFTANYDRQMPGQSRPPAGGGASRPFLMFLLLLACVALGALLNWGIHERENRTDLSRRNEKLQNAYVVILANRGDVARFLTDPRTRLFHLTGHGNGAGAVTIAWQQDKNAGLLIGDQMPALSARENYVIWSTDQAAHPTAPFGSFRPEPADTFYQFQPRNPVQNLAGFVVSIETDRDAKRPSQIVYAMN